MEQIVIELSDDQAHQVEPYKDRLKELAILDRDDIWIADALVRRVLEGWRRRAPKS